MDVLGSLFIEQLFTIFIIADMKLGTFIFIHLGVMFMKTPDVCCQTGSARSNNGFHDNFHILDKNPPFEIRGYYPEYFDASSFNDFDVSTRITQKEWKNSSKFHS